MPNPSQPSTPEEGDFLRRFDALFSGRVAWESPRPDVIPGAPGGPQPQAPQAEYASKRKELWSLSRRTIKQEAQSYPGKMDAPAPGEIGGWIPWSWENQVALLGWMGRDGIRYGLELELMALLDRLLETIPDPAYKAGVIALLDNQGRIMHQRGDAIIDADTYRVASVQIGEALPHWQVSVYSPAVRRRREDRRGTLRGERPVPGRRARRRTRRAGPPPQPGVRKFHRGDDSLTAQQPGSGLGLSIARHILRDHDGDLTCREAPCGGAIFVMTLAQAGNP